MMNLVKWNPWREMPVLHSRMSRMLNDPFFRVGQLADEDSLGTWNPAVDLYEKDDHYVIKAELPGIEKSDIKIDLKDRVLTLSGERTYEDEVKEESYYRKERSFGQFQRAFRLPAEVDSDKIRADFKDGLLRIEVPKPEKTKSKEVTIH